MHIPPIGPAALVCLSGAGLLIEHRRHGAVATPVAAMRVTAG